MNLLIYYLYLILYYDVAGMLVDDILFFIGHYTLHLPQLYAKIHKLHHAWSYTTSIAVLHLHPLEFALCNVIPNAAGMILSRGHLLTMCIWFHVRILQTCEAHSNYAFPWMLWSGLNLAGGWISLLIIYIGIYKYIYIKNILINCVTCILIY